MSSGATQLNSGMSQERLYAAAQRAKSQTVGKENPAEEHNPGKVVSEQMSGMSWKEVKGQDGKKDLDLNTQDVVYISEISRAMSEERVEAPANNGKARSSNEQKLGYFQDKLLKFAKEQYSDNFFAGEIAKAGIGLMNESLSNLAQFFPGLGEKFSEILAQAKSEKTVEVRTARAQVASEKVLFGITTGARIV